MSKKYPLVDYGLYLILFLTPLFFFPFSNNAFELPKMVMFRVILIATMIAYVREVVVSGKMAALEILGRPIVRRLILGFLFVLLMGTALSVAPEMSFWGSYYRQQGVYSFMHYFLFFILLGLNFHKKEQWENGLKVVFAALLISVLYGLFQFVFFEPSGFNLAEISNGRIFATFGHPNYFGYYAVLAGFALLGFMGNRKSVLPAALVVILMLVAMLLSGSRGAFLGFFAAGTLSIVLKSIVFRDKRAAFAGGFLVSFIAVFAIFWTQHGYFGGEGGRSIATRFSIWGSSLELIKEAPVFGHGIESFPLVFQKVASPDLAYLESLNSIPDKAHNTLIEIAVSTGFVGLLVFLFGIFAVCKLGREGLCSGSADNKKNVIAVLSALGGIFVMDLVGFSMTAHFVLTAFLLAYLLFLVSGKVKSKSVFKLSETRKKKIVLFLVSFFGIWAIIFQNGFLVMADLYASRGAKVTNFIKAEYLYPNQKYYNYIIGNALNKAGEKEAAMIYAEKAGRFGGYEDFQYFILAGKISAEESYFEKAASLAPNQPKVYLEWGSVLVQKGQCESAQNKLKKYLDLVPNYWENPETEEYRLFYKENPRFDEVFDLIEECEKEDHQ